MFSRGTKQIPDQIRCWLFVFTERFGVGIHFFIEEIKQGKDDCMSFYINGQKQKFIRQTVLLRFASAQAGGISFTAGFKQTFPDKIIDCFGYCLSAQVNTLTYFNRREDFTFLIRVYNLFTVYYLQVRRCLADLCHMNTS